MLCSALRTPGHDSSGQGIERARDLSQNLNLEFLKYRMYFRIDILYLSAFSGGQIEFGKSKA